jgi:putative spermidine/putrescine transport system permease protein
MRRPPTRYLLVAGLVLAAGLPLVTLLLSSFATQWFFPALIPVQWSTAAWEQVGGGPIGQALVTSLLIGSATALLATGLALPIGRLMARRDGRARGLLTAAAFLTVAAPPVALGTGLQLLVLRAGWGGSTAGVVLGHLVPATGYLVLYFAAVLDGVDAELEATARTLGATPMQVVGRLLVPVLKRPVAEALALGFLISWAQVPLTLILGGGAVRTLAIEVAAYAQSGQDGLAAAAGLALTLPAVAAFWSIRRFSDTTRVVAA